MTMETMMMNIRGRGGGGATALYHRRREEHAADSNKVTIG